MTIKTLIIYNCILCVKMCLCICLILLQVRIASLCCSIGFCTVPVSFILCLVDLWSLCSSIQGIRVYHSQREVFGPPVVIHSGNVYKGLEFAWCTLSTVHWQTEITSNTVEERETEIEIEAERDRERQTHRRRTNRQRVREKQSDTQGQWEAETERQRWFLIVTASWRTSQRFVLLDLVLSATFSSLHDQSVWRPHQRVQFKILIQLACQHHFLYLQILSYVQLTLASIHSPMLMCVFNRIV